ncbi:hypothetical protein JR316_0000206 [Psilocybe cubensis]|uniref:Yeast cell wall synthesis Kre9/Knh1-like N-terminal domain-containing protein n=2 Tax=Psilocybe cubensis TaxID=181762 RepID=A0A8H7Y6G5_PSICU|nr:hypothetical protein JR316_0000206 [Psilocybe cubensis]KAH9486142.1 hypothetical protein JR316_0000206 [Psilocybe cubensis]
MFSKLGLFALFAPLVSALTLTFPSNATSGGEVTITWTVDASDPSRFSTFSFELINESFNNAYAIANNVDPALLKLTLTLPVVPVGAGYTLQAVNIGDINDVFATSSSFSIGAAPTPLSTTVSVSSTNLSSLRASSASVTSSGTRSATTSGTSSATSLVVTSSTPTSPSTTGGSASNTAGAAGTTPFSGAISTRFGGNPAGIAAVLLSAAAGAAMIAI